MGGHGGLNILPQKRWNVYNFENREKVRKDEEAAAREEQSKREETRRRDSESRLHQLRLKRGLEPPPAASPLPVPSEPQPEPEAPKSHSHSKHINLFEGIKIFDPVAVEKRRASEHEERMKKKMKKEERVVGPEDEKYKLGYGLAGKGVKVPWYMAKPRAEVEEGEREGEGKGERKSGEKKRKTLEELREERLKREKAEKERARALLVGNGGRDRSGFGYRDRYYER